MKKIDLGQTLEILANVGVLASVVFLALEIGGNTAAIQQQEIGALLDQDQALSLASADEELSSLYVKSFYEPTELSLVELRQMTHILSVRVTILRRIYNAFRNGVVDEREWQRRLTAVPIYWGTSFGRVWWEYVKADYIIEPDFVDAVDNALQTSPIAPDDVWLLELHERTQNIGQ